MASNSSLAVWVLDGRGLAETAAFELPHPPITHLSSRVLCGLASATDTPCAARASSAAQSAAATTWLPLVLLNRILLNIDPRQVFVV